MNLRPSGYEPDELPDCSTPRQCLFRPLVNPAGDSSPPCRPPSGPCVLPGGSFGQARALRLTARPLFGPVGPAAGPGTGSSVFFEALPRRPGTSPASCPVFRLRIAVGPAFAVMNRFVSVGLYRVRNRPLKMGRLLGARWSSRPAACAVLRRPGSDLLSHALRRSTISAEGFHVRVRDGIGCWVPRHNHQVIETRRLAGVRILAGCRSACGGP